MRSLSVSKRPCQIQPPQVRWASKGKNHDMHGRMGCSAPDVKDPLFVPRDVYRSSASMKRKLAKRLKTVLVVTAPNVITSILGK
ncbi:MAG TPA: hypothetical protein DDW52_05555 [Planctomycetaceae bacterium]|nr:hypothetical protein [Planctomycetaceae bacterium]